MNILDQYVIPLKGLKEGEHTYSFNVSKEFFDEFENSEFTEGSINVDTTISKHATVITVTFKLNGFVNVICDRCLDNFNLPVNSSNILYIKFGENKKEDNDIIYISEIDQHINVAQYIYEFINFSIPLKRVHPENENGESLCNSEMINRLNEFTTGKNDIIDPRWEDLKKLNKK